MQNHIALRFYNASFTILLVTCALLPLLFVPASIGAFAAVKYAFLYIGVLLSLTTWIISQFVEGTMQFPKHWVLFILALVAALSLLSSFFSPNVALSLWGKIFSFDSFATIAILALFAFLVSLFAREQRRLVKLFLTMFFVSAGTVFLQIILFLLHQVPFIQTYFGHVASSGTLVGTWVDFSFFTAFTFILSILMIEVLALRGLFRTFSLVGVVVSLSALTFLNFKTAWLFAVISALLVFVYKSSVERALISRDHDNTEAPAAEQQKFPLVSFISLLIGLFFLLGGSSIGGAISRFVGLSFSDIRLSLSATLDIARPVLLKDPIFGGGPARFAEQWALYKPAEINNSVFWNTAFEGGYSTIATFLVTNGTLVTLALILTLALALIHGFRLFNYSYPDRFTRFIAVSSLILLIPFTALFFIGLPSIVLAVYCFFFIGLLIGVSVLVGRTKLVSFHYLKDPRSSFFIILVLVVASLATLSGAYLATARFVGTVHYNRALIASETDIAIARTVRALSFSENSLYLRTLSALYTAKFVSETQKNEQANQVTLQQYFSNAEATAQRAVQLDPTNALNWQALGKVYQLVVAANAENSYENAKAAFARAITLAPTNPTYQLSAANLEAKKKDNTLAQAAIEKAIELKPDFLDAYVFRADLARQAGDTTTARRILREYVSKFPYASIGHSVLGSFEFELKEYQSAKESFSRARALNPNDLDAQLRYINVLKVLGQKTEAIGALEELKTLFPNLKEGIQAEIDRLSGESTTPKPETVETEE